MRKNEIRVLVGEQVRDKVVFHIVGRVHSAEPACGWSELMVPSVASWKDYAE